MCELKDFASSKSFKLNQMTGSLRVVTYSATSEVFPYPVGATSKVTPALLESTSSKIDLREIKFGDGEGGTVRERLSPEITPGLGLALCHT